MPSSSQFGPGPGSIMPRPKGPREAGLNAWTPPPLNHEMNGRHAATFPSFVVQQEPFFGARALLADGWDAGGESFDRIVTQMRLQRHVLLVAGALLLLPVPALAAAGHAAPKSPGVEEAILVAEIVLLVLVGRLIGEVMLRIGQPSIIGQLLAGVVLGPSIFGKVWPQAHNLIFPHDGSQKA